MKHVVPSETVAHLWASKAQADARNSGNFYFKGDTIYSYGQHFPIARHVSNSKGVAAIFFTTRSYSITTSGHKSIVSNSIPGSSLVFRVDDVTAAPNKSLLAQYQAVIDGIVQEAERANMRKSLRIEQIKPAVEDFNAFAKWLGSKRKPKVPNAEWYSEQNAKVSAYNAKQLWREMHPSEAHALREKAREKRDMLVERKRLEKKAGQASQFEAWLAGGNISFPDSYRELNRDYLRMFNGNVETSRHAYVPLEHVAKVAPLILRLIESGKTYQRNGHTIHLGNYSIESLDAFGTLTVGCHKFSKNEVLRFAATLPTLTVVTATSEVTSA